MNIDDITEGYGNGIRSEYELRMEEEGRLRRQRPRPQQQADEPEPTWTPVPAGTRKYVQRVVPGAYDADGYKVREEVLVEWNGSRWVRVLEAMAA